MDAHGPSDAPLLPDDDDDVESPPPSSPPPMPLLSRQPSFEDGGWKVALPLVPMLFVQVVGLLLIVPILPQIKIQVLQQCGPVVGLPACSDAEEKAGASAAASLSADFDTGRYVIGFLASAFIGRFSDAVGRKPVLVFVNVLQIVPLLALYLWPTQIMPFFFGSLLMGPPSGWIGILTAYVADLAPPHARTKLFGFILAVMGIGLALTPAMEAMIKALGWSNDTLFAMALGAQVFTVLYAMLILPESLPPSRRTAFSCSRVGNPLAPLRLVGQSCMLRLMAFVSLCASMPEGGVAEVFLFYCDQQLGLRNAEATAFNAMLMAALGVSVLIVQTVVLTLLLRVTNEEVILLLATISLCIHFCGYGILQFFPYEWIVWLNMVGAAMYFLLTPAQVAIVSRTLGRSEQGFGLGTLSAINSLTKCIGPMIFGKLFAFGTPIGLPSLPFWVGAVLSLGSIAAVLFWLPAVLKSAPRFDKQVRTHSQLFGEAAAVAASGEERRAADGSSGAFLLVTDDDDGDDEPAATEAAAAATEAAAAAAAAAASDDWTEMSPRGRKTTSA